ncbi:MAG: zinc ribbon domain-containing protein [Clostridia bacterium]|nr:zinc ribbon domain-containing protein [Clostridia bacterium]
MECKNCGNLLNEDSIFCAACGTAVEKEEKKEIEIATCGGCGRLIREENKFCPHCGYEMKKETLCKGCGQKLAEGTRFCPSCGTKAQETQGQEPPRPAQQPASEQPASEPKAVSKKNSILSMAFGIASVFCGLFSWYYICPFIFIAGSIIFGSLSNSKREAYIREAGEPNGFTKAGKITTTVSIPVTIVFGIIGVVLFGVFVYAIAQGMNS